MSEDAPKVMSLVTPRAGEAAAALLRQLAEEADRGEVTGVCVLFERPGGVYEDWHTPISNKCDMGGRLISAGLLMLGFVVKP